MQRRRTSLRRALWASLALHAVALALLFLYAPSPVPVIRPLPMEIVAAEELGYVQESEARPTSRGGPVGNGSALSAGLVDQGSGRTPAISAETGGGLVIADVGKPAFEERRDPLVSWLGAPGTPGGPEHPDEALDGIGRLGAGVAGDPRIPGFGGTDLGALIARDSAVALARERASRGQIHPFLADAKARMESCWKPDLADGRLVGDARPVEDPVCSQGYHLRHRVAKVLVIYDAAGSRISLRMIGAPDARRLQERVTRAIDEAHLEVRPPPAELLDERGLLRLAWNVYVDDYTGCNLMGEGTSGKYDGGIYVVGVIELEGVF